MNVEPSTVIGIGRVANIFSIIQDLHLGLPHPRNCLVLHAPRRELNETKIALLIGTYELFLPGLDEIRKVNGVFFGGFLGVRISFALVPGKP